MMLSGFAPMMPDSCDATKLENAATKRPLDRGVNTLYCWPRQQCRQHQCRRMAQPRGRAS